MFDIVVVGSCNIDMSTYTEKFPRENETVFGTYKQGFGGKGANQAVMAARLGAHVEMVGALGNDSFGKETILNFKNHGINTNHIPLLDKYPSGIATIIVDSKGTNIIIVASGSNLQVTEEFVESRKDIIGNAKIVICQLEIPIPSVIATLKIARSKNVMTILNTAPAQKALPDELFALCDIVCPNETETEILAGIPVHNVEDAKKAGQQLLNKGSKNVIITLGEKGSVWLRNGHEAVYVPAEKVEKVTDTTGAGDCYIGSLAFYLAKGRSIEEAMKRATQICAIKVQGYGTQSSYPYMKDLPSHFQV